LNERPATRLKGEGFPQFNQCAGQNRGQIYFRLIVPTLQPAPSHFTTLPALSSFAPRASYFFFACAKKSEAPDGQTTLPPGTRRRSVFRMPDPRLFATTNTAPLHRLRSLYFYYLFSTTYRT
jgi:hypothetical protein